MLPKIDHPIYSIKIPSTDKAVKFRPFLVKEEKLLLMAKETGNMSDILHAYKQVVNNCCIDPKFDIDKIALFDLEYLFLKLRAFSVDNIMKASFIDNEDKEQYDFEIDLNKIEVKFPEKIKNRIPVTDKISILMKYPPAKIYDDEKFLNSGDDFSYELIKHCIDKIYYEEDVYESKEFNTKELETFLDSLNIKTFQEIQNFLINLPKMEYVIEYTNSTGKERKITLSTLNDFFS